MHIGHSDRDLGGLVPSALWPQGETLMKNRIYFFTGTGNSLWLAKEIAKRLPDCELAAIKGDMDMTVPAGLARVGFVYPTYGWASPLIVADFFRKAVFPEQSVTYYFAVTTCGGLPFNAIPQANALLAERGIHLNYGKSVRMFKNSVVNYNMSKQADKIAEQSAKRALPVIRDIAEMRDVKIKPVNQFLYRLHLDFMKGIRDTAADYQISGDCVSCGLCATLCPVKNVTMENGKPVFGAHCERCLACLQHCPKRAINYKDKTQKRGRYAHPKIKPGEIAQYY
jgi:ferredoxin